MKLSGPNKRNINFPYLYDGDAQATASKHYGPVVTPHVFIFDKSRHAFATDGRIDNVEKPTKNTYRIKYAAMPLRALLQKQTGAPLLLQRSLAARLNGPRKTSLVKKALMSGQKNRLAVNTIEEPALKEL